MLSLPRLSMVLATAAALCWVVPGLVQRATQPDRVRSTAYYSAVTGQFHLRTDTFEATRYSTEDGQGQTVAEHRRDLPFVYAADLAKHRQFPAQVAGQGVTVEQARQETQVLAFKPQSWNTAGINLNTLLESAPWGTRLSLPDDMFRLETDGLTFLRTADGGVDAAKSTRFTAALTAAGVRWPLRGMGGNPSPLKDFDEGYLLVDADGRLFQLKQRQGEPEIRALGLTVSDPVRAVAVSEHPRREILGTVVTDSAVLLVTYDGRLIPLPAVGFSADSHTVQLRTDPLNRTVVSTHVLDPVGVPAQVVATDRAYQPIRTLDLPLPEEFRDRLIVQRQILAALFPLSLVQYSPAEGRVILQIRWAGSVLPALAGCLLSVAGLALLRHRRGRSAGVELLVPLLLGPAGLVAVLLFGPLCPARRR